MSRKILPTCINKQQNFMKLKLKLIAFTIRLNFNLMEKRKTNIIIN